MLGSVWCNGFDPCASPLEGNVGVVLAPFVLFLPFLGGNFFLMDGGFSPFHLKTSFLSFVLWKN